MKRLFLFLLCLFSFIFPNISTAATITLTSDTGSGFLETDFDQMKLFLEGYDTGDLGTLITFKESIDTEAEFKTLYNLEIGTDVQAYHATLAAVSNITAFTQNRQRYTVHTAEPTDESVGDILVADGDTWNPASRSGTNDYMVICIAAGSPGTWMAIRDMVTGELLVSDLDLTGGSIAASYTISSPQSLSVTTEDDVTVGTELTSSVVLLTGDNDTDNDTLTLQDGITAGTILSFFMAAGVDTDDNIIIDAETDSTCTGCPDSGIFTFTANGGSLTLYWSGSAWFFRGQVDGE